MTNKFNARKTSVDGIVFASKLEADRYVELKLLQAAGEIIHLELQPEFLLQKAFRDGHGKKQRAIKYIADFKYREGDKIIIEEVKGYQRNAVWRLKKKMFLFKIKNDPGYELRITGAS